MLTGLVPGLCGEKPSFYTTSSLLSTKQIVMTLITCLEGQTSEASPCKRSTNLRHAIARERPEAQNQLLILYTSSSDDWNSGGRCLLLAFRVRLQRMRCARVPDLKRP